MTTQNKRYFGISILLILVGIFKVYSKGIYQKSGEINWVNLIIPLGMGIIALLYLMIKMLISKTN